ncbi:uncharacterized protein LOC129319718 [Prosopis cineraria]|uniref:uncharacterized protein LOC129319718 n=1 Tax=Prosopis cineraria TaxID=364024 RepID=UPI0024105242|nr:uncharacterized protein LOC129319718 [Prosopis cineraria]
MAGLKPELVEPVRLFKPRTMQEARSLARMQEIMLMRQIKKKAQALQDNYRSQEFLEKDEVGTPLQDCGNQQAKNGIQRIPLDFSLGTKHCSKHQCWPLEPSPHSVPTFSSSLFLINPSLPIYVFSAATTNFSIAVLCSLGVIVAVFAGFSIAVDSVTSNASWLFAPSSPPLFVFLSTCVCLTRTHLKTLDFSQLQNLGELFTAGRACERWLWICWTHPSIRHKAGAQSSSRRPAYTPSPLNGPARRESSDVHEGFLPAFTKNLEPDKTGDTHKFHSLDNKPQGSGVALPTVHMHTSLMARRILEHIDRNPPTPQQKSAELNLATKWKNPESSVNANGVLSNENNGFLKLKDANSYKYDGYDGKKSTLNEIQGSSHVDSLSADKSINVNNATSLPSGINVGSSFLKIGSDARSLQNTNGAQNFPMKSTEEDASKIVSSVNQPSVKIQEKIPLSNYSIGKPVLPSININKPEPKWTLASDRSSGFTFPVSAASSVFSEPPTPSIVPSFSTGGDRQSKEIATEPSYSFGSKRSSPALVFSFPSTSSTAVQNDAGDIKFSFGSNDKARLSFSSFGTNAVC